jgi:uncharacterized damage-inducible protein DinB
MLSPDDVAKMSVEEKLARLAEGPGRLAAAVDGQPEAILVRRPDAKNWAPKEVVCHLRDAEELFMGRFQAILGMDEPKLFAPGDADRWAEERQYLRNDAREALRAFGKRREESLALIRGLAPEQWQRGGIHPTRGRMTVGDFVNLMVWHDANHLAQLERALRGEA